MEEELGTYDSLRSFPRADEQVVGMTDKEKDLFSNYRQRVTDSLSKLSQQVLSVDSADDSQASRGIFQLPPQKILNPIVFNSSFPSTPFGQTMQESSR